MVDTAFVLAGGLGTRLKSIVSDVPKPMAGVAGRPFLEHLLDYLVGQGVEHIVLCVGHMKHIVQDHFGYFYRGKRISYSHEEELSGTGGALSRALLEFQPTKPFLVCNGDTFFPIDTSKLEDAVLTQSWAIATFATTDIGRYGALCIAPNGVIRDLQGALSSVQSESAITIQANSGVWLGNPGEIVLPLLASEISYSLDDYLSQSIRAGTVTALAQEFDETFIDIGVPKDFARAQTMPIFVGG